MKKIGIITFHRTTNSGSILQTFGLFKAIQKLGYECEIIDYRCPAIEEREHLKPRIKWTSLKSIIVYFVFQPKLTKKAKSIVNFLNKKMKLSDSYTPSSICKCVNNYDKIFVGSDIVWGRDITQDDYNYFLDFVKENNKKFSYASSVGDCIIREDESRLKKLLKSFNKITVREDEAVDWVKKISGVDASLVCDPTMLLTAEEWENEIPTKKMYENYILVYFDTDDGKLLNDAIKYAKNHNKKVVYINYWTPVLGVKNVRPIDLNQFLSLIKYADMVMTASYHGILFSLYFERELMYYTRVHSSRVKSLARKVGIEDKCGNDWNAINYKKIDYSKVSNNINCFRNDSKKLLLEMLKENDNNE